MAFSSVWREVAPLQQKILTSFLIYQALCWGPKFQWQTNQHRWDLLWPNSFYTKYQLRVHHSFIHSTVMFLEPPTCCSVGGIFFPGSSFVHLNEGKDQDSVFFFFLIFYWIVGFGVHEQSMQGSCIGTHMAVCFLFFSPSPTFGFSPPAIPPHLPLPLALPFSPQ